MPLKDAYILGLLEETSALQSGHFQLSSGRHSTRYVQCASVLQHPLEATKLGAALAERCSEAVRAAGHKIDVVISPAVGGLVLGQEVARALKVRSVFAERDASGQLTLRRGFYLEEGEQVLLVDDVLTTGKSFRELLQVVQGHKAVPVGFASLAQRGDKGALEFKPAPITLVQLNFEDYSPEDCVACAQGTPIRKPGSRPNGAGPMEAPPNA